MHNAKKKSIFITFIPVGILVVVKTPETTVEDTILYLDLSHIIKTVYLSLLTPSPLSYFVEFTVTKASYLFLCRICVFYRCFLLSEVIFQSIHLTFLQTLVSFLSYLNLFSHFFNAWLVSLQYLSILPSCLLPLWFLLLFLNDCFPKICTIGEWDSYLTSIFCALRESCLINSKSFQKLKTF